MIIKRGDGKILSVLKNDTELSPDQKQSVQEKLAETVQSDKSAEPTKQKGSN